MDNGTGKANALFRRVKRRGSTEQTWKIMAKVTLWLLVRRILALCCRALDMVECKSVKQRADLRNEDENGKRMMALRNESV